MGRTVIPIRYEITARLDEIERFARSLRDYDRQDFEQLRAAVHRRIGAMSYGQPLDPLELMQWCALLELFAQVRRMRDDVKNWQLNQER